MTKEEAIQKIDQGGDDFQVFTEVEHKTFLNNLKDTEDFKQQIDVRIADTAVDVAKVRVGSSMTINMDNFESVRIHVEVELPCVIEELDDCFTTAKQFVDLYLNKEVADVRKFRDNRREGNSGD